jgi:cytidylate kinase
MVSTLGQRGMAVVVGRGASAILPAARTLRVLIVAPAADRAARLAAARGLSAAEAEQRLAAEDAARRSFLRDRLGVEGDDPLAYDLVVNLEHLSTDSGAALVVDALRRRFPPAGARSGR